jgi:hypothetical protein
MQRIYSYLLETIPVSRIYRVINDLRTQLQENISYIFVIKNVRVHTCPIVGGYRVIAG